MVPLRGSSITTIAHADVLEPAREYGLGPDARGEESMRVFAVTIRLSHIRETSGPVLAPVGLTLRGRTDPLQSRTPGFSCRWWVLLLMFLLVLCLSHGMSRAQETHPPRVHQAYADYRRAEKLFGRGFNDKALDLVNKAISKHPESERISEGMFRPYYLPYYLRGRIYYQLGQFKQALDDFQREQENGVIQSLAGEHEKLRQMVSKIDKELPSLRIDKFQILQFTWKNLPSETVELHITGEATDEGSGIQSVLADEHPLSGQIHDRVFRIDDTMEVDTESRSIVVVAIDNAGNRRPLEIPLEIPQANLGDDALHVYAVIVGVDTYDFSAEAGTCQDVSTSACGGDLAVCHDLAELRYGAKDAEDFYKFLRWRGVPEENLQLLVGTNTQRLATRERIVEAIRALKGDPHGTLFFFFSGHGVLSRGGQNLVLPMDVRPWECNGTEQNTLEQTALSVAEVNEYLMEVPFGARYVFLDACRVPKPENIIKGAGSGQAPPGFSVGDDPGVDLGHGQPPVVFYATGDKRPSVEWPKKENGFFTYYLLQGLRLNPTLGALLRTVQERVIRSTEEEFCATAGECGLRQTPVSQLPKEFNSEPDLEEETIPLGKAQSIRYRIFYATDRRRSAVSAEYFGKERGTGLTYGHCDISIPKDHRLGELERPVIWRLEFSEDPEKFVTLLKVVERPKQEFFKDLAEQVTHSKSKEALVFIHGYDVTFAEAARRTAQLAYDLGLDGVPILYSWPSQGDLSGYVADKEAAGWSVPHLKEFLEDIGSRIGATDVYLVAHSMGNALLAPALLSILSESRYGARPPFSQIVLTAPDIDAQVFREQIAPHIPKAAKRITLYTSSDDKALHASKRVSGGAPRLGDSGAGIVVVDGIDTVDVSAVDTSFIGHSYIGNNRSVISDLFNLLRGKPPSERFGLKPRTTPANLTYWAFVP